MNILYRWRGHRRGAKLAAHETESVSQEEIQNLEKKWNNCFRSKKSLGEKNNKSGNENNDF